MLDLIKNIAAKLLPLSIAMLCTSALADSTTSYTYTADGQVATIDGPRVDVSDVTTYGYDSLGNRTLVRNALGHETQTTAHDGGGSPLTVIDANGLTTQLTYDLRGRLLTQSVSDGTETRVTSYSYDPVGNLTEIDAPDGSVLTYEYDAANRLIGIQDGAGNRIDYTLNSMGKRLETRVTDPNGVLRQHQLQAFSELSRLTQSLDADSNSTAYTYDATGNLTQTKDANLHATNQTYDALDRLKQTTDAKNGTTTYTYDAQDNLTSVTDPNGLTTSYTYDYQGNVLSLTSPDTGTTTYTYDEAGNRLTQTDARGITVSYSYDALNRLTQVSYPDTSLNVSYQYDQGTNGIARLTSMTDANGITSYTYNAFGQPLSKTRISSDNITTSFSYGYDSNGRLISQTYPSGRVVNYGYDLYGQLISLSLTKLDGTSQVLVQNIQQLPFGPMQAFDYGNGLSLSRTFDLNYRLIDQTINGVLESSYQHDPVGNITQWQDLLDTGRDQQFGYDQLDRLTSATGAYGSLSYSYDATGNRLSLTDNSAAETYSYVPNTHRLQQVLGSVTDDRTYDAAGNTIQSLIGSYTYDDTNRMVGFTKTGTAASYAYNGTGERIQKTVNGTLTRYRYGENAQLLGEYDQAGQAIREYIYLNGQPVAQLDLDPVTQTETIHYLHTDHLGAVVKATDGMQTLVWDAERKPFGERSVSVAQIEMPLGFPGQYFDEETGSYYNYFRDYDPTTGRYLQSDPIGLKGGLNTFAYVENNPLLHVDPKGTIPNYGVGKCVALKLRVALYCKSPWYENGKGCNCETDSCDLLKDKLKTRFKCMEAQMELTLQCYRNNPTHVERLGQEVNAAKKCLRCMKKQKLRLSGNRTMTQSELRDLIFNVFEREFQLKGTIAEQQAWDSEEINKIFSQYCDSEPPISVIEYYSDALPTFQPEALTYFIRFFLLYAIDHPESQTAEYVVHFLSNAKPSKEFWKKRITLFTSNQKRAICFF